MGASNYRLSRLVILCIFYTNYTFAQGLSADASNTSLEQSYPVRLYYTAIGENAHIYNGYEYMTPDRNTKGSPYFLTDAPTPANLFYDDIYYQDIPILYDQVRDLVVINRLDQNFKISLISEKLDYFTLHNHHFIRISRDSTRGDELAGGFYDRVYKGRTAVLVKRKKTARESAEYTQTILTYTELDSYYVKLDGRYTEVNNKTSVLKLFEAKKSEIKSYLRKNKLKFKADFEKTLIAAAAYYDQLTS